MLFGLYLAEDFFDLPFFVNQESHAVITQVRSTHEFLLAVSSVTLGNRALSVGQEPKRQIVFPDELLMRLFAVEGNSQDFDATLFEFRERIAKGTGLFRASRGIVFGIKV